MPRVNVKDKRKQQLMEANIVSIARRGLEETTIAHVSKGADMSRGIVNFYFTSKEKMMQETLTFLADEYTAAWQEALAAKRKETDEPSILIQAVLQSLLSDRVCSARRMAVWAAFIGHAGTHTAHARIVRSMDEALIRQLKDLWQKAGVESKTAEQRARQMHTLIRGHWLASALDTDTKRPSSYCNSWLELLQGAIAPLVAKEKVVKLKSSAPAKPKKSTAPDVLPGQLDFGDLFSRK